MLISSYELTPRGMLVDSKTKLIRAINNPSKYLNWYECKAAMSNTISQAKLRICPKNPPLRSESRAKLCHHLSLTVIPASTWLRILGFK